MGALGSVLKPKTQENQTIDAFRSVIEETAARVRYLENLVAGTGGDRKATAQLQAAQIYLRQLQTRLSELLDEQKLAIERYVQLPNDPEIADIPRYVRALLSVPAHMVEQRETRAYRDSLVLDLQSATRNRFSNTSMLHNRRQKTRVDQLPRISEEREYDYFAMSRRPKKRRERRRPVVRRR